MFLIYLTGQATTISETIVDQTFEDIKLVEFSGLVLLFLFFPLNILVWAVLIGSFYFNEIKSKKSVYSFLVSFLFGVLFVFGVGFLLSPKYTDLKRVISLDYYYTSYWVACLLVCLVMIPVHSFLRKRFDFLNEEKKRAITKNKNNSE